MQSRRNLIVAVAVALGLLSALFYALAHSILLPALHMDGTFQTSSMLYRMAAGNMPGRDFLPYLGLGPLYVVYPGFLLLGRNVSAALGSAYLMTVVGYAGAATLMTALYFRVRRYRMLLLIFAGLLAIISITPPHRYYFEPGNSLRPLRSSITYLGFGLLLLVMRHIRQSRWRYLLCGAIAGFALIWSNDYGIPTCLMLLVVCAYELWSRRELTAMNIAALLVGVVAGSTLVLTAMTAGHPGPLLHYNFHDVAGDQYWYFGNDPRINKIIGPRDLRIARLPIATILVLTAIVLPGFQRRIGILLAIGWTTFLGAFVAIVGGHYDAGYMDALTYWELVAVILILPSQLIALRKALGAKASERMVVFRKFFTRPVLLALYFGLLLIADLVTLHQYRKAKTEARQQGFYVQELGGYLTEDQRPLVEYLRTSKPKLLEEYWGLGSAILRETGPWPVDSAIAALGSQRTLAKASLAHWDGLVTTTRKGGLFLAPELHKFQAWAVDENWWLYGPLLQNYEPVASSPDVILWKKAAVPKVWPPAPCHVQMVPEARVDIDGDDGFYEMTLHYTVRSRRWHAAILAETNTAIFDNDTYGFISINAKDNEAVLPVYISRSLPSGLLFQVYPESVRKDFVLESCTARKIVDPPGHIFTKATNDGFFQYKTRDVVNVDDNQ